MGFVKSAEELREVDHLLASPRVVAGEGVMVHFLLDERVHAELVPPPLRPANVPRASLVLGRWQSSWTGDTAGGIVSLRVQFEGVEGNYPLNGWFDSEPMVTFSREVLGEPLKLATSGLYRSGGHARGWIDRHGVRLVDVDAELGPEALAVPDGDAAGEQTVAVQFNVRAHLLPTGLALDGDPTVTRTERRSTVFARRPGTARLMLTGGPHDPLDELAVTELVSANWVEFEQTSSTEVVGRVSAADFLPYHLGRGDDLTLLGAPTSSVVGDRRDSWW